jgi:molybdenum cofactor sulfurtransferase
MNLYSNPHSHSASAEFTAKKIADTREQVKRSLFHLVLDGGGGTGGEGWDLVFTSGCTASLKLVGESFFSPHTGGSDPAVEREFWVADEAHTSLLGIRDLVGGFRGKVGVFSMDEVSGSMAKAGSSGSAQTKERPPSSATSSTRPPPTVTGGRTAGRSATSSRARPRPRSRLIGFPAQCNASGRRYFTPELCSHIRRSARFRQPDDDGDHHAHDIDDRDDTRTYILLDAASYLSPSQTLDLSQIPYADAPDFITFSFYKIYGYPTGLGGLLVKRSSEGVLMEGKRFWGGGTLQAITPGIGRGTIPQDAPGWKVPKSDLGESLEDGSINVHGIAGISHGPACWARLFGEDVRERGRYVRWLTRRLVGGLGRMEHANGEKVARIYMNSRVGRRWIENAADASEAAIDTRDWDADDGENDQGPIINFNIVHPSGRLVPPTEVDRLACVQNIHIRSGRHCNPGFIVNHLLEGREDEIVRQYEAGMGCDESANAAVVAASLRISLGVYNTPEDVDTFLTFVKRFWVFDGPEGLESPAASSIEGYELNEIRVYPIKSCAGQTIEPDEEWRLTPHGLEYDREWILMDKRTGKGLSQKKYPRMALVKPRIDVRRRLLVVRAGDRELSVDLDEDGENESTDTFMQVCVDTVNPKRSDKYRSIDEMLSDFLSLPCALARQVGPGRHSKLGGPTTDRVPLLLSNESPFLLLNQHSVDKVSEWIAEGDTRGLIAKASSFRGNFVIGRPTANVRFAAEGAFQEDAVYRFQIGPHTFIPLGACRRCQMVSIDQETGEKAPETFLTIAKRRRDHRGRILFGTHMMWLDEGNDMDDKRPIIKVGMKVTMTLSE